MCAVAQHTGLGMGPRESMEPMSIGSVPDRQMLELYDGECTSSKHQKDFCLFIAPGVEMMDELWSTCKY